MRKFFTLLTLSAFLFMPNIGKATDYTIGDNQTTSNYKYMPFSIGSGISDSFTQQLYLASELTAKGASAGNITAISFKYVGASSSTLSNPTRSTVEVWIRPVAIANFSNGFGYGPTNNDKSAGTKYFEGSVTLPTTANTWYTITLDNAFEWNGSSNIIITINDKTNAQTSGYDRNHLVYSATNRGIYATASNAAFDASLAYDITGTRISYVPVIKFTFEDSGSSIPVPTSPYADNESTNSADIHWTAAEGADSYSIRYRTSTGAYGEAIDIPGGGSVTSYTLSELEDGITYYYQIRTNVGSDYSEWTDEDSFSTTAIIHEHDGISFSKWTSTNSLPSEAGNYYLNSDVTLVGNYSLSGSINLCLNGHDINTYVYNITVPNSKTLTIYDNVGTGSLSGFYESTPASAEGLITIENGGTLVIKEGSIQNLDVDPNDGYLAYAIYNKGTLRISGNPVISGHDADISLFNYKYITLDGALTNTTKYSVNAGGQTITSGWSTYMSGEKPSDYFESAKSGYDGICVVSNEAKLVKLLALDEDDDNDAISDGTYAGTICVSMTRSLTSSQYNTFCLPFALNNAQLEEAFGAGYDLREFESASLEEDVLSLTFSDALDALEAGKPYLLKPSVNVTNPSFEGVTISATSPADQTSDTYISFHGTYAPTELTGGNRNLLFLGAGNELFWPATTANIKGFRAYFEVKGGAQGAKRARIVKKEEGATGIENQKSEIKNQKFLKDGQLLILRDNKTYNVLGMEYK